MDTAPTPHSELTAVPPAPRRSDEPTVVLATPGTAAVAPAAPDLTVTKVLAAAGAAATSAVLGSALGAAGTVAGAAIGAVATTVASVLYQRSLERTRTALGRMHPGATVPGPRVSPEETTVLAPVPSPRRRRRVRAVLLGVLAFVLAMATITGVELARGSTVGGSDPGTSVGRVVGPPPVEPEPVTTPDDEETTSTDEPDATPTGDATGDSDATPSTAGARTAAPDEDSDPDVPPEDDADAPDPDDVSTR